MVAGSSGPFTVGDWLVEPDLHRISRASESAYLRPQVMAVLVLLASQADRVVSSEELLDQVWAGKVVTDGTVYNCIAELRQAFGNGQDTRSVIETIPKKGYRLLAPVAIRDDEPGKAKQWNRLWIAPVTLAIVMIAALALREYLPDTASDSGTTPSIAVLPFADLSPNSDQQYLADGIADELLNELARLQGLAVKSRTASFAYKGSDESLQSIAARLRVANILEGSVRREGDALRITVQLINALTGNHLWSNTYDRTVDELFDIQSDIARSVAGAMSIALDVDGRNTLHGTGTDSIAAYEAYLEGRALASVAQVEQAVAHYQRAIELDPGYAEAWSGLGGAHGVLSWKHPSAEARAMQERGYELVLKAIDLDPELPQAYRRLASFLWARGDWLGSAEARQQAAMRLPGDVELQSESVSLLHRVGRVQDALEIMESYWADNAPGYYDAAGGAALYIAASRYDEARGALDIAERAVPTITNGIIQRRLFIALSESDAAAIRRQLEQLVKVEPPVAVIVNPVLEVIDSPPQKILQVLRDNYADAFEPSGETRITAASLAAYYGEPEFALQIMAEELGDNMLRTRRLWYPFFSEMRRLPGFKSLAEQIGFVDYWRVHGWADVCRPLSPDDFECT